VAGNDGHCCTSSGDVGQKFAARQIAFLTHGLLPLLCGHYRAVARTLRMLSSLVDSRWAGLPLGGRTST
jgi:hypothetical protein